MRKISLNKSGQAAIEYLLMLLVIVSLISALSSRVYDYFLGNQKDCERSSKSFICRIKNIYNIENYRYFTIRR